MHRVEIFSQNFSFRVNGNFLSFRSFQTMGSLDIVSVTKVGSNLEFWKGARAVENSRGLPEDLCPGSHWSGALDASSVVSRSNLVPSICGAKTAPGYVLRIYHFPYRNIGLATWVISVKAQQF